MQGAEGRGKALNFASGAAQVRALNDTLVNPLSVRSKEARSHRVLSNGCP